MKDTLGFRFLENSRRERCRDADCQVLPGGPLMRGNPPTLARLGMTTLIA
jgi:hypothetical protein